MDDERAAGADRRRRTRPPTVLDERAHAGDPGPVTHAGTLTLLVLAA